MTTQLLGSLQSMNKTKSSSKLKIIQKFKFLIEDSFRFTENSHIKAKHRIPHLFSLVRKMYLHLEKRTSIQNNALLSDWSTHFEVEYDWIELTQQLIKSVQHSE